MNYLHILPKSGAAMERAHRWSMFSSTKSTTLQYHSLCVASQPPSAAFDAAAEERVSLAAIVSALSFALDLTEGAAPGHALRTCLLGMRIGSAIGLEPDELADLYYALLLKDSGCSSNSARMYQILGSDERKAKAAIKTIDWTDSSLACGVWAWNHAVPNSSLRDRIRRLLWMKQFGEPNNVAMFQARCDRGAEIALKAGASHPSANAIYCLDEHWNGAGFPAHLRHDEIPLLSRILAIAQHLDVFAEKFGRRRALQSLRRRSTTWFDPSLVRATLCLADAGALWPRSFKGGDMPSVMDLEPSSPRTVGAAELDRVCEGFAGVVDAKSPMTFHHSVGVMEAANLLSDNLHLAPEQRQVIYRAALLHDIGKLGISNAILDSPRSLTPSEWRVVRQHPRHSEQILARVPGFERIASIAGRHHERLDGSGYPHALKAPELTVEDRIVAAADVYATCSEQRPYRAAMAPEEIAVTFANLKRTHKLDPRCCEILIAHTQTRSQPEPPEEAVPASAHKLSHVFS